MLRETIVDSSDVSFRREFAVSTMRVDEVASTRVRVVVCAAERVASEPVVEVAPACKAAIELAEDAMEFCRAFSADTARVRSTMILEFA